MTRVEEAGDYATRVAPAGPPELTALCRRLNHLVAVLGSAMEDRRQLAGRLVSLQDSERKEVASELHDEFGPYLFALRAHVSSLEAAIGGGGADAKVLLRQSGDDGAARCPAAGQPANLKSSGLSGLPISGSAKL